MARSSGYLGGKLGEKPGAVNQSGGILSFRTQLTNGGPRANLDSVVARDSCFVGLW